MNKPVITVERKTVYGNDLIYPSCEKALAFAKLTGKKTFSLMDIKLMQFLGFDVEALQVKWEVK
jgi:hypothetical protein